VRSYQTLAVIGGVLGLIIVFSVYAIMGSLAIFLESFSGDEMEGKDQVFTQVGISAFLYIVAIILPFVIKQAKYAGYSLIVLAIVTLISAGGFGIIGFALLIAGGIAALRWKEKPKENSALDLLRNRYANGEISKEEFEKMKEDLD
jgi:putative membrane protein